MQIQVSFYVLFKPRHISFLFEIIKNFQVFSFVFAHKSIFLRHKKIKQNKLMFKFLCSRKTNI